MWSDGVGVRVAVELRREPGPPSVGEVVSADVATGTNDEPLFLTMCVKSSLCVSRVPVELLERPRGSVSGSGQSSEVSLKVVGDFGWSSAVEGVVGERAEERALVVSTTVGEQSRDGTPRYVRTASRICSSAVGRS